MNTPLQDLRYGARTLAKNPGFTLVALLTLALGIGANTAIFSVVNAVLLRPLPYPESARLVVLDETNLRQSQNNLGLSYPNFLEWREQSRAFENVAAYRPASVTFAAGDEPVRVPSAFVTASLFPVLRIAPAFGRGLLAEEDRPEADPVAVVSHGFWQRRFGGAADLVGKSIVLNGRSRTVVGIMPEGFQFPLEDTEIWVPFGPNLDQAPMKNRAVHIVSGLARLKPGVSVAQANVEMASIARRIQEQYPGTDPGHGMSLATLHDVVVGRVQPALLVLLGAVGLVLLIACVNVANLLLARAAGRQRELAIRAALGASRGRVIRQLLTESLLLAFLGGGLGLLLAFLGNQALVTRLSVFVPRASGIGIDSSVLGFSASLALLTGAFFGVAPALRSSRLDLNVSLKDGGAKAAAGGRHGLRSGLVVAEIASSLVLLVGAGLMMKSFWRLQHVDPGFKPENLLTLAVSLPEAGFREDALVIQFYRDLPSRLATVPGVTAVSAVSNLPISGGDGQGNLTIEGRSFPPGGEPAASFRRSLPNYFQVMGIPLAQGREFDERDTGVEKVVIINESFARRFWPGGDAIGKRIKVGPAESEPWLTIVGVTGDVHNVGLDADPSFATYEPLAQRPRSTMSVVVRTSTDPLSAASSVRAEIRQAEKDVLIGTAVTFDQRLSSSVAPRRFNLWLLGSFAGLALILAMVGIYGVMSYALTLRTREIGIRMALGARASDVLRQVAGEGLTLILAGVGIGLAIALSLTRVMATMLYGISATDPVTFAAIALLLTAVALVACLLPARRAARVDPMIALRND